MGKEQEDQEPQTPREAAVRPGIGPRTLGIPTIAHTRRRSPTPIDFEARAQLSRCGNSLGLTGMTGHPPVWPRSTCIGLMPRSRGGQRPGAGNAASSSELSSRWCLRPRHHPIEPGVARGPRERRADPEPVPKAR